MPDDRRPSSGDRPPWDRPWGIRPPAPEPDPAPQDGPATTGPEQVSVADLLRRLGHRGGSGRRRAAPEPLAAPEPPAAPQPPAAPRPPAAAEPAAAPGAGPAGVPAVGAPTTRLPRVPDEPLPVLGGEPGPPEPTRPARVRRDAPAAPVPATAPTATPAVPPRPSSRLPALSGRTVPSLVTATTRLQAKKAHKEQRSRRVGKVAVTLLAAVVFLTTGAVWGINAYLDSQLRQVGALDQGSAAVVDPVAQTGDENYLLVGSDTRAGTNGEIGAGTTADAGGARSDTVMLAHVPADRTRVVVISFPRDLQVDRPDCARWDNDTATYTAETEPGETDSKLNAAYSVGGPRCLVKTIQQISGLAINHFVGIDFSGFQKMVDEVGGVTVCTETPLVDDELGTILADPGTQLINGTTALNYVRARKVEAEGTGDYGRITRQQRFLASLLRTALSNKVLFDPGKLTGFVREFTAATFNDNTDLQSLLTLGQSLQGLDAGRVTFITVPTTGTSYDGNEIQNRPEIAAIFRAVIDDRPLPGEEPAPTTAPTTTTPAPTTPPVLALAPATVTYGVLNATQTAGLATQTAAQLTAVGFGEPQVADNYGSESPDTFVQYSAGQEAAAATLASTVPGTQTRLVDGLGDRVELVVGTGFAGTVVAPTAAGQPLATAAATPAPAAPLPPDLRVVNGGDTTCG
ncbi:hypothetical protein GCM10027047_13230 [Rhodococcus aerolatus]